MKREKRIIPIRKGLKQAKEKKRKKNINTTHLLTALVSSFDKIQDG